MAVYFYQAIGTQPCRIQNDLYMTAVLCRSKICLYDNHNVINFITNCILIDFEEMTKETSTYKNVFYEEKKVCNRGRARYQLDLAPIKKFPVSEDFAAAVCGLPDDYSERTYFNFIERWGTVSYLGS